ncbi:MAG: TetR/AcrR family transcriptional regulator [bacterium]|nr:TetR/AcrR family transcriptional regulator [bacterium]
MPKIVDNVEQRRAIRGAAQRVFARRGIKGTGLAHVAEAAGMGRSSLYHYYPDKESLVRDLLTELLAEEEAVFAAVASGEGSSLERIERLIRALMALLEPWSAVGRMILELRASETRRFRGVFKRIRRHLATAVSEGQECGEIDPALDPILTASTLIGAADGFFLQYLIDPAAFPNSSDIADELVHSVRKMLVP